MKLRRYKKLALIKKEVDTIVSDFISDEADWRQILDSTWLLLQSTNPNLATILPTPFFQHNNAVYIAEEKPDKSTDLKAVLAAMKLLRKKEITKKSNTKTRLSNKQSLLSNRNLSSSQPSKVDYPISNLNSRNSSLTLPMPSCIMSPLESLSTTLPMMLTPRMPNSRFSRSYSFLRTHWWPPFSSSWSWDCHFNQLMNNHHRKHLSKTLPILLLLTSMKLLLVIRIMKNSLPS